MKCLCKNKNISKYLLYLSSGLAAGIACFCMYHAHAEYRIRKVEHGLRHCILIAGNKNQYMTIAERMHYYHAPAVSIAVIDKNKLQWTKGYGADTHTLFQAGSISKPVTALGALLLVQQGKLSLDVDVNKYLKSWHVPENEFTKKEKVTLRRLLSHSAGTNVHGFPGYSSCTPIPTIVEILDGKPPRVNTPPIRVVQTPGTEVCYSGGGITIVQLLIEDVTGEKFETWMNKNILIPFGMHESTFNQPLTPTYSELAACGHNAKGTPIDGKWHIYPEMAAAGLWTTPTDLAHFLTAILNILHGTQEGLIKQELLKTALSPQMPCKKPGEAASGLGFFLNNSGKSSMTFGHNGQDEGFIAEIVAWPALGKGFVIMINNDGARGLIDEIKNSMADTYGLPGFERIVKKAILLDPAVCPKFTGVYKTDKHTMTINMRDNALFLLDSYLPNEVQLYAAGDNSFFVKENKLSLQFLSSDNKIDGIVLLDADGNRKLKNNQEIVLKKVVSG